MKATGIARKVDDLGRITIPKEIRTAMRINEEDKLEFYVDGKMIGLMKQVADEISSYGKLIATTLQAQTGFPVVVCDTEKIVYASGDLGKRLAGQDITDKVYKKIRQLRQKRNMLILDKPLWPTVDEPHAAVAMVPILNNKQDIFGAILLIEKDAGEIPDASHLTAIQTAAAIIGGILDEPA